MTLFFFVLKKLEMVVFAQAAHSKSLGYTDLD